MKVVMVLHIFLYHITDVANELKNKEIIVSVVSEPNSLASHILN